MILIIFTDVECLTKKSWITTTYCFSWFCKSASIRLYCYRDNPV